MNLGENKHTEISLLRLVGSNCVYFEQTLGIWCFLQWTALLIQSLIFPCHFDPGFSKTASSGLLLFFLVEMDIFGFIPDPAELRKHDTHLSSSQSFTFVPAFPSLLKCRDFFFFFHWSPYSQNVIIKSLVLWMFHDTEMWTKINLVLPFSSKLNIYINETDAWAYLYSYAYQLAKQNRFSVFPLCSLKH